MNARNEALFTLLSILGAVALWLVLSQISNGVWRGNVIDPSLKGGWNNVVFMASGLGTTVLIALVGMLLSLALGLVIALPGLSSFGPAKLLNRMMVEYLRAIPPIVMLLWIFYALPILTGQDFFSGISALFNAIRTGFWNGLVAPLSGAEPVTRAADYSRIVAGIIALGLVDAPFVAEIYRSGFQSIERGQHDAADALGLTYGAKMRLVLLPQVVRIVLPALGNQFVLMVKMSSLVYVLGAQDLTQRAGEITTSTFLWLEPYTFLVLEYLILVLLISGIVRLVELRLRAGYGTR